MANPRPSPACRRVLEESACRKRSKTYGRNAGSIPGPSSVTESSMHEPASSQPHLHPPPRGRELHGVGQQVPDHLLQPARVTRHGTGRGIDRQLEPDVPGPRGGPHGVRCRFDHLGQPHRAQAHVELAGDDPRHVQDVGDELGLGPGVAIDGLDGTAGGGGIQARLAQDVRPGHDGIERRAQLVRQGGQELVLQPVGLLRLGPRDSLALQELGPLLLGLAQRLLDPLAPLDLLLGGSVRLLRRRPRHLFAFELRPLLLPALALRQVRDDHAEDGRALEGQQGEGDLGGDRAPAPPERDLAPADPALGGLQQPAQGDRRLLVQEARERRAQHRLHGHVQQRGQERVAVEHDSVVGQRGRALLHLFHHQAVGLVGALQREDLVFPGGLHDQRVHFAAADGTQRLLQLLQPGAQPLVLFSERAPLCLDGHGASRKCARRGPGPEAPAPSSRGRRPGGATEPEAS